MIKDENAERELYLYPKKFRPGMVTDDRTITERQRQRLVAKACLFVGAGLTLAAIWAPWSSGAKMVAYAIVFLTVLNSLRMYYALRRRLALKG